MTEQLLGRFLALLVGVEWFFLLIFGGQGLVVGPIAWVAALTGRRWPTLSVALLVIPAGLLFLAWLPAIVTGPDRLQAVGIAALLAVPALVAARLIAAPMLATRRTT